MPGWHEATKKLQQDGTIRMVGVIQEQHPDRCRLFMQWKGMDWPVMVDALNLFEVKVVPLTFLIDEHGVIRARTRRPEDALVWAGRPGPEGAPPAAAARSVPAPMKLAERVKRAADVNDASLAALARDLFLWGDDGQVADAVAAYETLAERTPDDPRVLFRLGVAQRKKFDLASGEATDFRQAVESWQTALDGDPNQYIWRRRIQQYGPRLMKPYPFYDWVPAARAEIESRGEEPVELLVEPGGAEFAAPRKSFGDERTTQENPDPDGRIHRDEKGFVRATAVVVPSRVRPGDSARVHVSMTPDASSRVKAHWNNEVADTVLWIEGSADWQLDQRWHSAPRPKALISEETRRMEFELRVPEEATPGKHKIPAYALYYVCEGVDSACLYRRQDIEVEVDVVR